MARRSPHLVIDGVALLARAVRAGRVIIAVRSGGGIAPAVWATLSQRPEVNRLEIMAAPPRFVASEASSLVSPASGADRARSVGWCRSGRPGWTDAPPWY